MSLRGCLTSRPEANGRKPNGLLDQRTGIMNLRFAIHKRILSESPDDGFLAVRASYFLEWFCRPERWGSGPIANF
jgi:hypothetical protein